LEGIEMKAESMNMRACLSINHNIFLALEMCMTDDDMKAPIPKVPT
jgi:hypothetical protein